MLFVQQDWRLIQGQRWLVCMLIGVMTGMIAVLINISIIMLVSVKKNLVYKRKFKLICKDQLVFIRQILSWFLL